MLLLVCGMSYLVRSGKVSVSQFKLSLKNIHVLVFVVFIHALYIDIVPFFW